MPTGLLGTLERGVMCMCMQVRMPEEGCSPDQVESQVTKLFPMLACLEASKEEPRTGQGLWGNQRGRRKAARKGHQACPTAVLIARQEEKC